MRYSRFKFTRGNVTDRKKVNQMGKENIDIGSAIMGAEGFSFFVDKVPGINFFIGGVDPSIPLEESAPHHIPDFFVHDSGMLLGVRTMSNLTLDYMKLHSSSN